MWVIDKLVVIVVLLLIEVWWQIRGVPSASYRAVCRRCKQTGQAHWWSRCIRFKA